MCVLLMKLEGWESTIYLFGKRMLDIRVGSYEERNGRQLGICLNSLPSRASMSLGRNMKHLPSNWRAFEFLTL